MLDTEAIYVRASEPCRRPLTSHGGGRYPSPPPRSSAVPLITATDLSYRGYAIAQSYWRSITNGRSPDWHVTRPCALMANSQHQIHTILVDSMALMLRFISATRRINVQYREGKWHYLELPDAHICGKATVELYPVQMAFAILVARHHFDNVKEIRLPDGTRIPFSSTTEGYPMRAVYGEPVPGAILHRLTVPALAALPTNLALVWRRLGFPHNAQWTKALAATEGAFPPALVGGGPLPDVSRFSEPAVLRSRMKQPPLPTRQSAPRQRDCNPEERVYMNACGPMLPALHTRSTDYFACVCAATGYGAVFLCSGQSERHAKAALPLFIAEARSVRRSPEYLSLQLVRTDGGSAFVAHGFREFCTDQLQALHSVSAPYTPDGNSFVERLWQTRFGTARVLLSSANLSARFHVHAVRTANWLHNRLPSLHRGGKSPYELMGGRRPEPDLQLLRAFGCVAAVWKTPALRDGRTGYKKPTADHADFGVYLGPSETSPAHLIYLPRTNKVVVSAFVDFDESTYPGIKGHTAMDWRAVWDAVPLAMRAEGDAERLEIPPPSVVDALPTSRVGANVLPTPAVATSTSAVPPPDTVGRDGRAKRHTPQRAAGYTYAMTPSLTQPLPQTDRPYLLYLCSDPARNGDFESWIHVCSADALGVVNVDTRRHGYDDDLSMPTVAARVRDLATRPACRGALITIPCTTWSAARMADDAGPQALRDCDYPCGIPDPDGRLPSSVRIANAIADHCVTVAEVVLERNGDVSFENLVDRSEHSPFAIAGRTRHSSLWSYPPMVALAEPFLLCTLVFDRCRLGADAQKTFQLLSSLRVHEYLHRWLSPIICDHGPGAHTSLLSVDGVSFRTKGAETFTSALNRAIAESFVEAQRSNPSTTDEVTLPRATVSPAVSPPDAVGRDGRAKRHTPQRAAGYTYAAAAGILSVHDVGLNVPQRPRKLAASALQRSFASLTGMGCADAATPSSVTPHRLHSLAAPLFGDSPACAYSACVGAEQHTALSLPGMTAGDFRVPKGFSTAMRGPHSELVSIRIVLAIAAAHDWGLWQLDVKQAFLQADVQEPLYTRLPPNLPSNDDNGEPLVCKLRESLYGLKQAALEWSERPASQVLVRFGFRRSVIDTCVYRCDDSATSHTVLLLVYVDDIIMAYSYEAARLKVLDYLHANLPVDDRGELVWILRMEVARDRRARTITLSQLHYSEQLVDRFLPPEGVLREYDSPLDEESHSLTHEQCPAPGSELHAAMAEIRVTYMSAVGGLLWVAAGTRPDLTYTVSLLARFCSNPGPDHYAALLRTLSYLRRTYVLRIAPRPADEVVVYSDASWLTKNSVSGGLILVWAVLVACWARLQKSVSASTCEAEAYAAALASHEGVYVRDFMADVGFTVTKATPLMLDSKSAIDLASDPVAFKKTKHILRHTYELRDRVARGIYAPLFVDTESQLADILTKGLRLHQHKAMLLPLLYLPDKSA